MVDVLLAKVVSIHQGDPRTAFAFLESRGDMPSFLREYEGPILHGDANQVLTWNRQGLLETKNRTVSGLLFRPNRRAYEAVGARWVGNA